MIPDHKFLRRKRLLILGMHISDGCDMETAQKATARDMRVGCRRLLRGLPEQLQSTAKIVMKKEGVFDA